MTVSQQVNAFGINNMVLPSGGPKTIPWYLDFSATTGIQLDTTQIISQGLLEYVQTLYIDNKDNPGALTMNIELINQRIIIPAGRQGYWNILGPNPPVFDFSVPAAFGKVYLQLINVPIQPANWS